jgi:hypothetical protein
MPNVDRLPADPQFRGGAKEPDEGGKKPLAYSHPSFLRYGGVQISQDFRVSSLRRPPKMLLPAGAEEVM